MSDEEEKPKSWWHTLPGIITSLAAAVTAVVGMVVAIKQTPWSDHPNPPPVSPETAEIWQALESGDYHAAINKARICIKLHEATARKNQSTLAKNHEPDPPVGRVSRPEDDKILERYDLNSMATCLYLLGEASVNLKNIGDARNAYKDAIWYTYARDWAPPWFWSPAVAAHCRVQMDLDSWDHGQAKAFAAFLNDFNAARKDACRVRSQ